MKKLVVLLCMVVLVLAGAPAHAAQNSDPNDSDSRLDIAMIKVASNDRVRLTLRTFGSWGSRFMRDALPTSLTWYFDAKDDGDADLIGEFRFKGGHLAIYLRGPDTHNHYEAVHATRPNKHTVKTSFSSDIPELRPDKVSVYARSVSSELEDCPGDPCRDRAPDSGRMDV